MTSVWLRFSPYEAQILSGRGYFLIPVGTTAVPLFTLNALIYRSIPFAVVLLLMISSAFLVAHTRLAK